MKASERKAQIVEVAIGLFGRKGFSGTTTKRIAEAAGISEATIFKHFPSKEGLYAEAFRQTVGESAKDLISRLQSLADKQDDEGLLRALFGAILYGYERDRNLHRMLLYAFLEQEAAENQQLREDIRRYPLFAFLARYIKERQGSRSASEPSIAWYARVG